MSDAGQTEPHSSASPTDRSLILRCQRGDLQAFNELVKRYEKVVYNFAYRLTGSYDDANDVAQEAFVRAYNAIGTFRGDAALTTWLFRITTNIFLDQRKRERARPHQSLDEYIDLEESSVARQVEDPSPSPQESVESKERAQVLADAIAALPDYQRAMVLLYHTHEKSYEEIAQMMDLPIGTVKSRLNRARLALKEKLADKTEFFPD